MNWIVGQTITAALRVES